ncbi:RecA-like DNA recombinase [Gordonia phage Pons]|uniref:RecA-like DNA recombinase n=1 Tax=Gordonia phage Pons TaxID=2885976 RepID=A0AAE8Y7A6_9CAUD|nr:RecA-like DNA recombinase [Gordonia phage Pons]UDL15223.1 RecA-like DNA recombinase [Gordonia phage Pons]
MTSPTEIKHVFEQMKILKAIWRGKEGYVFMPWIPAEYARTKMRKQSWQEGEAETFHWPSEEGRIVEHLREHWNDDLYFAPMIFSQPKRKSEYATDGKRLWADLDEADPRDIEEELKPTHAWETSPGRYAAVWSFTEERTNVSAPGGPNHRLTMHVGADKSGWDTTQLLRVPGSANNKPDYPEGIRGRLLWRDRGFHTWKPFENLPAVKVLDADVDIDEQLLEGIDRYAVWGRVKLRVSRSVREYMSLRQTMGLDRSHIAWQIERELADAGCSLAEIVAVIRPTIWNKFDGRQDEVKRLMTEASKALSAKKNREAEEEDEDDDIFAADDVADKPTLTPFWQQNDYLNVPEPSWLVDPMIPAGGCGFIAGIPKSLKSWLALDLAISLATGEDWLGHTTTPQTVLYIQEEDPTILVRDRHNLIASSKDPKWALDTDPAKVLPYPKPLFMQIYSKFDGTDAGWQAWLKDVIEEHEVSLVILDTLATIAPGVDIDSGREVKGELLDPLKDIARSTDAAVLIVHHMTKSAVSDRAGQNMAGSGQIHAWADFGLYVTNKDEKAGTVTVTFNHETKYTGTRVLKYVVDGLSADPPVWNPELQLTADEGTQEAPKGKQRNTVTAHLREIMPNPDHVDPLGADIEGMGVQTRLRRAIIKQHMDSGTVSVAELADILECDKKWIMRRVSLLMNDYPDLTDVNVSY